MNQAHQSVHGGATLSAIPAFNDNYIWIVQNNGHALVVDPGQAQPASAYLAHAATALEAILITHHHADHTGGAQELKEKYGAHVYAPQKENIAAADTRLQEGDELRLGASGLRLQVLDVPGHTAGHIAYICSLPDGTQLLFCGDALFSAGCGRVFEGSPAQMLASLGKMAALPAATLVCCAHEYTLANLHWALAVLPEDAALRQRLASVSAARAARRPSLPSTIGIELQTNPFLRCQQPELQQAASRYAGRQLQDPVEVFACLREWKNNFKQ